jgi:tetratricopeptide (TPR) repeat protein/TolB-like protein
VIAGTILAIAAAVLLLKREYSPGRSDVPENSLAVMYFDNQSGEKDLDRMLISMLTTNLARDKDLVVASDQRLFDILNVLGKGNATSIDRSVATEVARRAHVRTMLLGSIIRIGSRLRITAQLLDVDSGDIIGSDQANGSRIDDLFPMVDDLTRQIIENFHTGGPTGGQQLNIADVSTHSIEAYRSYREGLEHLWRWEPDEAAASFTKAIILDTSFALAYVQLAVSKSNMGIGIVNPFADLSDVRASLNQATKYLSSASEKERQYITLYQAMYSRDFQRADSLAILYAARNPDDAQAAFALGKASWLADSSASMFRAFERVLEIDPTFAIAYNELAYSCTYRGEYARAVSTIKKRLALQHDVIDAYDSGVEVYVQSGLFDEARNLCEQALQHDSTWSGFLGWEATIALFQGDGVRARSIIERLPSHDTQADAEKDRELCYMDVHEGRYRDAVARMERWLHFAQAENRTRARMFALLDLGRINTARGNYRSAVEDFRKAVTLSAEAYPPSANPMPVMAAYNTGVALVREGDVTGALSQAAMLQTLILKGQDVSFYTNFYHMLLAEVYLRRGNNEAARSELDSVSALVQEAMPHGRALAAAILAARGMTDSAIHAYELSMNKTSGRYFSGYCEFILERSRTFYRLGRVYEQEGNIGKAREYYTKAIAQWKNADADLPELIDARRRLRGMQSR